MKALQRLGGLVTGGLLVWVPLAAVLGVVFADAGGRMTGLTPYLLAVMVFATGFTVPPARLAGVLRRPQQVLAVLLLQFGPLSLLALLLSHLPLSATVSTGILVLGVAPSEITAGLMVLLAGGDTALGTAVVGASLLAGTVVAPWLLSLYAGGAAAVDRTVLLQELTLAVGLPLIAASTLRGMLALRVARAQAAASQALWSDDRDEAALAPGERESLDQARPPQQGGEPKATQQVRGRDQPALFAGLIEVLDGLMPALAALAVIALLFIIAGTARPLLLDRGVFVIAALCLLLNVAGYAAGWGVFRMMRAPEAVVRAAVFTTGMREFGVAATIATAILPASAGVAGVYGIVILFTAPLLVHFYRRG